MALLKLLYYFLFFVFSILDINCFSDVWKTVHEVAIIEHVLKGHKLLISLHVSENLCIFLYKERFS